MKDIDFDELDKAVNSLMSSEHAPNNHKKPASNLHKKTISSHALSTSRRSTMSKNSSTLPPKALIDTSSRPSQVSKPTVPAVRRAGRFMDVVDSSAELNPIRQPLTSTPREIPRKVSQLSTAPAESPTVEEPAKIALLQPKPTPTVVVPPRVLTAYEPIGESVQVRRVEKDSVMPDPLDLLQDSAVTSGDVPVIHEDVSGDTRPAAAFGATTMTTPDTESLPISVAVRPVPQIIELISVPESPPQEEQPEDTELIKPKEVAEPARVEESESPFLVDAKIEKRPLNANPATMSDAEPLVSIDELIEQDQPSSQADIAESAAEIPDVPPPVSDVPELSSELVAIEATGKADDEDEELIPVSMKSSTDGSQQVEEAKANVGPASIAQQYKPKESTGDSSHTPIYDPSQYADPVAHPAKKKSGWLWVLGVLILLALGSGGAVALYLTGIIP